MTDFESPKNPRIAAISRLHRPRVRREQGRTLLEGPNLLREALAAGIQVEAVYTLATDTPEVAAAETGGVAVYVVSEAVLSRLAGTAHPRGPIAVISVPAPVEPRAVDSIVLAGVADPGNAGTIIRSAAALGFQLLVAGEGGDVWSPKVLRAGAGSHFRVQLGRLPADPTAALSDLGLVSAALVVSNGIAIAELPADPVAMLVGSEPHGLPETVAAGCDHQVSLPMPGAFESLNASAAAAIAMYERMRTTR